MNTYLLIYLIVFFIFFVLSTILVVCGRNGSRDDTDIEIMLLLYITSVIWPLAVILVTPIAIFYWRENNKEQIRAAKERELKRTGY